MSEPITGGRTLQTKGIAGAKTLGQKHLWKVQSRARRPMWLQGRARSKRQ